MFHVPASTRSNPMTKVIYEIVQHDGGWAYKAGDVLSETFASHNDALTAAQIAAAEQQVAGQTEGISYQDRDGKWHNEVAQGTDRPETDVVDGEPT
jgi:hypothetical protein